MDNEAQKQEYPFPTEVIDLPSKGVFYPAGHPLHGGQIEVKYMTAKEEDILSSANLIKKGVVLDRLMDSLIVTKGVKSKDLYVGDLNGVMVATRILGYGKEYPVEMICPSCGERVSQVVDLTELETKNEPADDATPTFDITLPLSKKTLTCKLLTRGDELEIDKEVGRLQKAMGQETGEITSRLRAMIVAVDGDKSDSAVWNAVEHMLVRDVRYLRKEYESKVPDVSFEVPIECDCSVEPGTGRLPIGVKFFWPDFRG